MKTSAPVDPFPLTSFRPLAKFDPLVLADQVRMPEARTPSSFVIYSYSFSSDGRTLHSLLPPQSSRVLKTRLHLHRRDDMMVIPYTPPSLFELNIETLGEHDDEGELCIRVISFRRESYNLPHGTPIAYLTFFPLIYAATPRSPTL